MEDKLQQLMEKAHADEKLKAKLIELSDHLDDEAQVEKEVRVIAAEAGIELDDTDDEPVQGAIDDADLDKVAGGISPDRIIDIIKGIIGG